MKTRAVSKILLILTFAIAPSFGQSQKNEPFTPDQRQNAQRQLESVGRAFGITPQMSPGKPESENSQSSKTMSDVADKALDMVGSAVASISQTVQNVAPHIWQILIRQQYAEAIGEILFPGLVLLGIALYMPFINKHWVPVTSDGVGGKFILGKAIPMAAMVVDGVVLCYCVSDAVMRLINPEYYAVKDLLTMLLNRPQ